MLDETDSTKNTATVDSSMSIQTGVVTAITIERESDRVDTYVTIRSNLDNSEIPHVYVDPPLYAQHTPVVGQRVMFIRMGNSFSKLIATFGERAKFEAPIEAGEVLIQSTGGGLLFLNNGGDVELSNEDWSNAIKMLSTIGILITANSLVINVKGIGEINITPQNAVLQTSDQIEILKKDGEVTTSKVTLTNDKIIVSGSTVEIGTATDPMKGGNVVSRSAVVGEYSYDLFTGLPIPKSGTVKSTIYPTG